MHHSTYLPLPTLESLAHSGSSSSASSRSSISLFNVDPQPSDSQTDASPLQTPEEAFPGDLSVSMAPHLKFLLPDHLSRLGLKTTPKQRLFMQRSNWSNKKDDMGYDSERESCISTARRDRAKVFTRKRGVPSRCQGLEVTRPSSEAKDTCEPEAPPQHTANDIFSPGACGSSVGAFQLPSSRKEVIGLGLGLGRHGLFRGTISIDNSMETTPAAHQLACPLKPRLMPVLDATSPSPITSLPSPVMVLGVGTAHRVLTTILDFPVLPDPTDNFTINQKEALQSASGNTDSPLAGVGLGICQYIPELQISDSGIQKTEGTFSPVINLGPGGPLSQAIAFASIPFFSAQPRRKKSAEGLGMGRPAALGRRPQMEPTSRLGYFPRLPSCAKGRPTSRCIPITASPSSPSFLCSPSRRRIVAGARRLLKPHNFLKRCLYAIPEAASPTFCSPIGMTPGRSPRAMKLETEEQVPKKQDGSTYMTSHPLPSQASITGRLSLSGARPSPGMSRFSPKSPNHETSRRSPIIIRLEVPQKLVFSKRRHPEAKARSGLCGLF